MFKNGLTKEKVLSFLNYQYTQKPDRFFMKLVLAFDAAYTILPFLMGSIKILSLSSVWDYLIPSIFLVVDIVFVIWYFKVKAPIADLPYCGIILLSSVLKLLYYYIQYALYEKEMLGYPVFGWLHLLIIVFAVSYGLHFCRRLHFILQGLKTKSIKDVQNDILKRRKLWFIPPLLCSPMVLIRLFRNSLTGLGVGMALCFWALMSIWLMMFLMLIPKLIIIHRYRVTDWFNDDGSIDP